MMLLVDVISESRGRKAGFSEAQGMRVKALGGCVRNWWTGIFDYTGKPLLWKYAWTLDDILTLFEVL